LNQELHEIEELSAEPNTSLVCRRWRLSLLDEFDPEGQDEYFRIMDERARRAERE